MLVAAFEGGMHMYWDFEDFIMVFIVSLLSYGFIGLVKNMVAKYKAQAVTAEGRPNIIIKKDILDAVKLLFGAQVVCLLFYITPAINENIKIILSLAVTLGSFVGTFLIKENKGYNSVCRGLIFIGQEFFGITMLLMMINKGMGYSITVIFALWALFNLYIMREFGKLENKMFFWITLIGLIISLLSSCSVDISAGLAVILLATLLLLTHVFVKKETIGVSIASSILFILMFVATVEAIGYDYKGTLMMFIITLVFLAGIAITRLVEDNLNIKAFLLYIPFIVAVLLVGINEETMMLIPLFNIIVAAVIASPKSICKKIIVIGILVFLAVFVGDAAQVDELVSGAIYLCSVIYVIAALLTPKKKVEVAEGGDCNE
jgi:hypothetical protein